MVIFHDPHCADYGSSMRLEQPARVTRSAELLRQAHPGWEWRLPPKPGSDDILLLAHTPAHLKRLEQPRDFDPDTPFFPSISEHARRAVGAALEGTKHALSTGSPSFCLMRPPGHHAMSGEAMGFCYLNQAAVAALDAQTNLGAKRVAVWDFDAHHGNGTEAILLGRPGFLYASVHQSPGYPGTGLSDRANSRNWPILPRTARTEHLSALKQSWRAVLEFKPDLILVSAGFDAYADDPITEMTLEKDDFATLGQWLRKEPIPTTAILEGGYSSELPLLIDAFLNGWVGV